MKRNVERRFQISREIERLKEERENALAAVENEEDEIYFAVFDSFSERIKKLDTEKFFLEYPEPRNTWFRTFSESFKTGKDIQISQKQAAIFMRYAEPAHEQETGRGASYYCRIGNRGFKCLVFTEREPAYLTITEF